jgi:hypothetical protein
LNSLPDPPPGERPSQDPRIRVLNPRCRVPVSLIIDDSTCLVNLAHYGIPQFAQVFPDRYKQDWRSLPREIPDSFVLEFAAWCRELGVKGKYSIVPYPACVGWVDRELPGWTRRQLEKSLEVVRNDVAPDWDIHPEMISHTRVIDTTTGRAYPEYTSQFMENWDWTTGRSADELANYMAYALSILKNAGLECEGITTPGGFGGRARTSLSLGTLQACRSVYGTDVAHYFHHIFTDDRSVAPRVEYASALTGNDPSCVVNLIGCTGDWFGGWDGLEPGSADQFIGRELAGGRLPEVIAREEPAIMVCHWPGIYFNGEKIGFHILQEVVSRLDARYDNLMWMKLSEIARYWAARELTAIRWAESQIHFDAPFAAAEFTMQVELDGAYGNPELESFGNILALTEVDKLEKLEQGTYYRDGELVTCCFNLPRGESVLRSETP